VISDARQAQCVDVDDVVVAAALDRYRVAFGGLVEFGGCSGAGWFVLDRG